MICSLGIFQNFLQPDQPDPTFHNLFVAEYCCIPNTHVVSSPWEGDGVDQGWQETAYWTFPGVDVDMQPENFEAVLLFFVLKYTLGLPPTQ